MSLATRATGDPESFITTASKLRRLGTALGESRRTLKAGRALTIEQFEGDTARSFKTTIDASGIALKYTRDGARDFSAAIVTYAGELREVQQVLRKARQVAKGRGLTVDAESIHAPGPQADADQHDVYDRLKPLVAGAWTVLADAEDTLRAAGQKASPLSTETPNERRDKANRDRSSGIPGDAKQSRHRPQPWPPSDAEWPSEHPPSPGSGSGNDNGPGNGKGPGNGDHDRKSLVPAGQGFGQVLELDTTGTQEWIGDPPLTPIPLPSTGSLGPLTIGLPSDWQVLDTTHPDALVAAQSPAGPAGAAPATLVVETAPVTGDPAAWHAQRTTELGAGLPGFTVTDSTSYQLGGRPVSWLEYTHTVDGVPVTSEQWAWDVDGVGLVMTSSIPNDDGQRDSLVEGIAEQFAAHLPVSPDNPGNSVSR